MFPKIKPKAIGWLLLAFLVVPVTGQLLNGTCEQQHCGMDGVCLTYYKAQEETFYCQCNDEIGGPFCEMPCLLECKPGQKCVMDKLEKEMCIYEDGNYSNIEFLATNCPPGTGGYNCSIPINSSKIDPCLSLPCNNGTCFAFDGGYQCLCHDGFYGHHCSEGMDHCVDHQCQHGAPCINTRDGYFCHCPLGRTGEFCERLSCHGMPGVCNHGECIDVQRPSKGRQTFWCECNAGYEGEFCTRDVDECLEKPCYHNGTCVNLHGSYRCDCLPGYSGSRCESYQDLCKYVNCQNNGTCVHTSDREPVCMCPFGFVGPFCEKPCHEGFGGMNCDIPVNTEICMWGLPLCHNEGKCINGLCVCSPDYIGDACEYTRKEYAAYRRTCDMDPCSNNATCIDVPGQLGYFCQCEPGFAGDRCEIPINVCIHKPCLNNGKCTSTDAKVTCECLPGFEGSLCEKRIECDRNPCNNSGVCKKRGDNFYCECPLGFSGRYCDDVGVDEFKKVVNSMCSARNCSAIAGNGHCDEECNLVQCHFDGGDCSGGQVPFSKCPFDCAHLFNDGVCHPECNREECLFDGFDCNPNVLRCPIRIRKHCATHFGDGHCDMECNSQACGFDGGDCNSKFFDAIILSNIRIVIDMDPKQFQEVGGKTMMELSTDLNMTIRIQNDEEGPMVFKWNGWQELDRIPMHQENLKPYRPPFFAKKADFTTVAYLEVTAVNEGIGFFTSSQSVVDLIGAHLAQNHGKYAFGIPISEALVSKKHSPTLTVDDSVIAIILTITFLLFLIMVLFVCCMKEKHRRKQVENQHKKPSLWIPNLCTKKLTDSTEQLTMERVEELTEKSSVTEDWRSNGQHSLLSFALDQEDPSKRFGVTFDINPLHREAASCDAIKMKLTYHGVNQIDFKTRRTVLHFLAANANGKNEIMLPAELTDCIDAGANVDAQDIEGNTPLILSVVARRIQLVSALLIKGADPTIANGWGRTALHIAASNKDLSMMKHLLGDERVRANIDEVDKFGMTALMIVACCAGDNNVQIAKLLFNQGAEVNVNGVEIEGTFGFTGRTALHFAALIGDVPMVRLLIQYNADLNVLDIAGQTPLMLAASEGHRMVVEDLVANFAVLTMADRNNKTAAQLARLNFHRAIAEYIEEKDNDWEHTEAILKQRSRGPPPAPIPSRKVYTIIGRSPTPWVTSNSLMTPSTSAPQSPSPSSPTYSIASTQFLPPLPNPMDACFDRTDRSVYV